MTPTRGYFYVVLAALCWGMHGALAKFLFVGDLTPVLLVQFRLTTSSLLLFLYLVIFNRHLLKITPRDIPLFLAFGIIGIATNFFLYYYAIQKVAVAMAIFLQYLSPSMIAVYWAIRGVKSSRSTVVAIVIALVGCFLVVKGYDINFLNLNSLGVLAGIGAAIGWSFQSLTAESFGKRYTPTTMLFYGLFIAAIFWNILYSPTEMQTISFTQRNTLGIMYVAIFGTIVPALLFFRGIAIMGATRAAVTATIEPIAAAVFAYFLVNESLGVPQILGGALVVGSIICLQARPSARKDDQSRLEANSSPT